MESPHPFYEGAYNTQIHFDEAALRRLSGPWILPFIHFGYLKRILDNVAPGAEVLELGCGGGMMLAAQRFSVTAVDLSLTALLSTPGAYRHRLQADVMEIQFLPARFDAIFASCFFEHFAHEQQEMLLERLFNWLRNGGKLILLFDTESRNPVFRWLRRYPDLYRRCFVEHDGHLGLEPVSVNRTRFAAHGFAEVKGLGLNRTAQHLPVCCWIAPYQAVSRWAGRITRAAEFLRQNSMLARAFTGAIHVWDLTLGRLFPEDWSRLYLGVWERPKGLRQQSVPSCVGHGSGRP